MTLQNKIEPKLECKISFDIPEGYFDNLADEVMLKIENDDTKRRVKRIKLLKFSAAASIVALAFTTWFQQKNYTPDVSTSNYENISEVLLYNHYDLTDYIVDDSYNSHSEYDATELVTVYPSPFSSYLD